MNTPIQHRKTTTKRNHLAFIRLLSSWQKIADIHQKARCAAFDCNKKMNIEYRTRNFES